MIFPMLVFSGVCIGMILLGLHDSRRKPARGAAKRRAA